MRNWCKNGISIGEADLGDLAMDDGEVFCELEGVQCRLTVETVGRQSWPLAPSPGAAAVLTLRQVGGPPVSDPIHLVGFADASALDTTRCQTWQCEQLAAARVIAARAARRYVCSELFRSAERLIVDNQVA